MLGIRKPILNNCVSYLLQDEYILRLCLAVRHSCISYFFGTLWDFLYFIPLYEISKP